MCLIFLTSFANNSEAQNTETETDTFNLSKTLNKAIINNEIIYNANDSMRFDILNRKVLLYGNAFIKYENTEIKSDFIEIDWVNNKIYATGRKDSLGKMHGYPEFKEREKSFKAREMTYNYKSKKGILKEFVTKEGEGFIHGKKAKKSETDVMFLRKGEYTTCDLENPHFSIRSNKIKVIPGKKIVSGPAYLVIRKIPTPLFLPFGFFPNTNNQSSGVLIPSYGESENLGFFLKNGGYYLTLNKYMDLEIRGDIYTKGSWATRSLLKYKKRYRYNGNINLSFGNMINSEKNLPDYSIKKDFFIRWKHKQDAKANPSFLFSANINAGSSTYHKNNSFNANDYLKNTFQSSISLNRKWEGTPYNLSVNLRHSQNTSTNMINLTIPDILFSMNRIFPFKKDNISKTKWFDKIGISYNMNTKNEISITDSLLFKKDVLSKFRAGLKHSIPISTSIKLLKQFTFSPRFYLTERWYFSQINKQWDGNMILTDTINKFTRAHDYNISTSLNTKLYGIVQFRKGKIAAFRHVLTPNLGFSYHPNFGKEKYGYYKTVQSDTLGNTQTYSIMQNGIYGIPGKAESGSINFSLSNLFDMKVRSKKDTIESVKKTTLIESMGITSSYNIFADSLKLNDISLNVRTRLLDIIDFTFSSRYDPYIVNKEKNNNLNRYEFSTNNRLARFTSANANIGINLSNKTFTNNKKNKENENEKKKNLYKMPWNFNANYAITYNKGYKSSNLADTIQSFNFLGNIKITSKWKIGFRSGYDFKEKELTYSSIDIYRDLHCWELLFHWIPIGFHKSYTITIRVKASILRDLKLEKKKDWIDVEY